jgi:hypothetical protein
MVSDDPKKRLEKNWGELVAAASMETDSEKTRNHVGRDSMQAQKHG